MYGTQFYCDPVLNSPYRQHDRKVSLYYCCYLRLKKYSCYYYKRIRSLIYQHGLFYIGRHLQLWYNLLRNASLWEHKEKKMHTKVFCDKYKYTMKNRKLAGTPHVAVVTTKQLKKANCIARLLIRTRRLTTI